MPGNDLSNTSGDERQLSTTMGAVPRISLIAKTLALEKKVNSETGAGYSDDLPPFGEALHTTVESNEDFLADCDAVRTGIELCDLWQHAFDWLAEELVYPYPDSTGGEDSRWLVPVIRWGILFAAAQLGKSFVGRLDLRRDISKTISAIRSHSFTSRQRQAQAPSISISSSDFLTPQSVTCGPATLTNGAIHDLTSITFTPSEVVTRAVKSIVGEPTPKHLIFSGAPTGAYFLWRVEVSDLLGHHHSISNEIAVEVILYCLTEPLKSTIRNSLSRDTITTDGAPAVWTIMDKRYNTNLELRALENSIDSLVQEPSERALDYCTRFEKLWRVKKAVVPDEVVQDSSIIRKLKKGLRDPKSALAASLTDPRNEMDFATFKDTLLAMINDLPDIASLLQASNKTDTHKQKIRPVEDDPNIIALCMAAATELGLPKDSCLRCGRSGHLAARCRAPPDQIVRKDERCRKCGRLADAQHRCDASRFRCQRCHRPHHLAGVCLKKFHNTGSSNNNGTKHSDVQLVNNSAAHVTVVGTEVCYTTSDLFTTASSDPSVTIRLGNGVDGPCCDTSCLVDSGANISLIDASVVTYLLDNYVVSTSAVSTLDNPLKVTYGNNSSTLTSTILSVPCDLRQSAAEEPIYTNLLFLQVDQCHPRVIIGRNMFGHLGIALSSTKGLTISGALSTVIYRDNVSQTDKYSDNCTTSYDMPHLLPCSSVSHSSVHDSRGADAGFLAPSTTALIGEQVASCHRASVEVQPLVSVVQDGDTKRLRCDINPIGNATVWPYRAAPRKRTPTDNQIIHQKLCAMESDGKVRRVQDSDLSIVCEPILIDKLDLPGGESQLRTAPVSDDELSTRYRLVIDTRPLNSLQLSSDENGNFVFLPSGEVPKDSKLRDEFSYKQYQRNAFHLLDNIPKEHLGYWSKLDLRDAFGSIAVNHSLQKLFGTTSICPKTGASIRWALCSLPQGWRWSSLAFQVGFTTLLDTVINPKLVANNIAATVLHVQDDVLISSHSILDGEKALKLVTDILIEHGFVINHHKSKPPACSTTFCGLLLQGRTYRPLPARREISDATFDYAFNDFLNGKAPKKRKGHRRPKQSKDVFRQSRLSWLRSWTGVFNYLSGHLLPDAITALQVLNNAIKYYQDDSVDSDFLDTLTTPISNSFKLLLEAYLAGTIPCSLGDQGVGTLAVVDANHDSYGAILFRVFDAPGDAAEFASYSKTVFNCIPHLADTFNIPEDRIAILPLRVCGERFSKVESSRSSTWRERAALLSIIHNNQGLLSGKVVAVTDNANVGKHWHSVETEFGIGSYLTKWQTYQRCVHLTTWAERGSLPAIADAIARSLETPSTSSPKPTVHLCHATNCGLAADGDDIEQKHAFLPSFTPATFMRDVFSAWRSKVSNLLFPVHDDDIDALQWLANAQSQCPEIQRLRDVNPIKFHLNGSGIITVNNRYVVPRAYARDIVTRVHTEHGHCGLQQTLSIVKEVFYVIGLSVVAAKILASCRCFFSRAIRGSRTFGQSLRHRRDTMELIYIDLVGPLPPTRGPDGGYRFILTWLDATSGFVGGIPLKKATSYEICNALERHVLDVYGRVKEIASDNGSAFSSTAFLSWCASFGIRPWKVPVYCPWRNGQLERCHRSIKATLRCLCDSVQHKWDRYLSKALFRCNSRIIPGTEISPFMVMFGESRTVLRRFMPSPTASFSQSLSDTVRNMVNIRNRRLDAIFGNADGSKPIIDPVPQCNQNRRSMNIRVGDPVLKWTPATGQGPLGTHWSGPFTVTHKTGRQTVILSDGSLQDCRNVRRWYGKLPSGSNTPSP